MADYYPPVGFHFSVSFTGLAQFKEDILFQSVSGLNVDIQTETIKEGGENRFEHNVPTRNKYSPLTLNRGLFNPKKSGLTQWCVDAFEKMVYKPIDLEVMLLNEKHETMMYWKVIHAWPKSWKIKELNAEKSEVLIETLELNYNRFEFKSA